MREFWSEIGPRTRSPSDLASRQRTLRVWRLDASGCQTCGKDATPRALALGVFCKPKDRWEFRRPDKLPETTPNATFYVATNVAVFQRKHGEMAVLPIGTKVESRGRLEALRRPAPRNVVHIAQEYQRCLDRSEVHGYRQVAKEFGVTKASVSYYLSTIRRLPPRFVTWLSSRSEPTILTHFTMRRLRAIARKTRQEQFQWLREAARQFDEGDPAIEELLRIVRDE